jgi:hypothetical protein
MCPQAATLLEVMNDNTPVPEKLQGSADIPSPAVTEKPKTSEGAFLTHCKAFFVEVLMFWFERVPWRFWTLETVAGPSRFCWLEIACMTL